MVPYDSAVDCCSHPALSKNCRRGGRIESSKQTSIGAERTIIFSRYDGTLLCSQVSAKHCENVFNENV